MNADSDISQLLGAVASGEAGAEGRLYALAYDTLHHIAARRVRRSGGALSLSPTALVNEAWLKLAGDGPRQFKGSGHFYALLAKAMRQVVVNQARDRIAAKRGGVAIAATLTEGLAAEGARLEDLLGVDAALSRLEQIDAALAGLVERHFFGGQSFVEIAAERGVTERTVRRHWEMARAVLAELAPEAL
jgi:RNA polymerase sigma factor (TIGR02999 family)